MARYRKKPVEIEARQFTGEANGHDVYRWIEQNTQGSFEPYTDTLPASGVSIDPETGFLLIATLEGVMQAKPNDWIIRGVQGEFYPCKPDIFATTYEPRLMPQLETRTCGRCGATADQVRIGVLISEPQGWTAATVGGLPITNRRVCPSCARDVRTFLATPPAEVERATDAQRELAFARGYDEGRADGQAEAQRELAEGAA